ncbi:MAG: hypothetical protein R3A45_09865 [Bdellovibrionota bacterium]
MMAGVWLLASPSSAVTPMSEYQSKIEMIQTLQKQILAQNKKITTVQEQLNNKGEEITELKTKKSGHFLNNIGLQKKMQDAQTLSKELDHLYRQKSNTTDQLEYHRKQLLRSIEKDLSKAHLHERSYTQALMNLHSQISRLEFEHQQQKTSTQSLDQPSIENNASMEQWIVLQDLQIYTQELIEETQQELAYEKQQKVLKKELSHLMNEEMFFGEQGFIQGTARKQNNATTAAVTKTDDNTSETPSTEQPTTDDPNETETEVPTTEEAPDTQDNQDINETDITAHTNEIDQPTDSIGFEEIDPKAQSLMLDSAFPEVNMQEPSTIAGSQTGEIKMDQRDTFWENPNEITNAILSLSPAQGESKEEFLQRKVIYLQEILTKLKKGSQRAKQNIESMHDEK